MKLQLTKQMSILKKITERDEEALKYLKDIKWCRMDDPNGFKLEFFFDTNPYFTNSVLIKVYHMIDDDEPILETILTQLQWRIKNRELCPVPVHRLGRGTSGILLCAKTKLAKTRLAALFADKTSAVVANRKSDNEINKVSKMSKIYMALACGIINKDEVIIDQPVGTLKYPGVANGLYVASPTGKSALSKVYVLKRDVQNNRTVVQVEIQSGRPHQIRIHLSFIGHPLIGDPLYVSGGKPQLCAPETVDETFAEDGVSQACKSRSWRLWILLACS